MHPLTYDPRTALGISVDNVAQRLMDFSPHYADHVCVPSRWPAR